MLSTWGDDGVVAVQSCGRAGGSLALNTALARHTTSWAGHVWTPVAMTHVWTVRAVCGVLRASQGRSGTDASLVCQLSRNDCRPRGALRTQMGVRRPMAHQPLILAYVIRAEHSWFGFISYG